MLLMPMDHVVIKRLSVYGRVRKIHKTASRQVVEDILALADSGDADAVELQSCDTDSEFALGAISITGSIFHLPNGSQTWHGTACDTWDAPTQTIAQDLDARALEGLPLDRQGRIDMQAWRATGMRDQIDGQTYVMV